MQIQSPDWVKHSVFYQIFPDRFAKGMRYAKDLPQTRLLEEWSGKPTSQGYKGGNLWGIIERLDYLQDLGISAIYLTPVFQSASNHRYHTYDYYRIDPLLGGDEAFNELLTAAHLRDIKIILDGVFNHASRGFYYFHDILENGLQSPWLDWFKIQAWPLHPYDLDHSANYACWKDNRALPQFNHTNPEVREYLMRVAEHWTRKGIDGWRLDEPRFIQASGFWQEFRTRIKSINPQAYIVGEVLGDANLWLDGTQFDGVTNYLFTTPTIRFTTGFRLQSQYLSELNGHPFPPLAAQGYAEEINRLFQLYSWDIQLTQLNFLANHDTARLITIANGDTRSIELAMLLLMSFPGAPCIYYGDEVGLPGGLDPDCRRGFPPPNEWNNEILTCHRNLIALRHSFPALRIGSYQTLLAQETTYIFARSLEAEELIIALNVSDETTKVKVEYQVPSSDEKRSHTLKSRPNRVLYGSGKIAWYQDSNPHIMEITLSPRSGLMIGSSAV